MVCTRINKTLLIIPVITVFCFAVSAEDKWASGEVNVRTGPGTTYDIMGQLYKNEKVEIFDVVNGWAQILFENVEGYVSNDLLLTEQTKTPEEEEAARMAAELEKAKQEKERSKSRIIHILIIIAGIAGTVLFIKIKSFD